MAYGMSVCVCENSSQGVCLYKVVSLLAMDAIVQNSVRLCIQQFSSVTFAFPSIAVTVVVVIVLCPFQFASLHIYAH